MDSDFILQEELKSLLYKEFSNKESLLIPNEKTEEDSKNSLEKNEIKNEPYLSHLNINISDYIQSAYIKKAELLMIIIEIGNSPKNYFKKYPNPTKKYFWFYITQKNQLTKDVFQIYYKKYYYISSSQIKTIFIKISNLNDNFYAVDIIKEFKDDINKTSLR